MLIFDVDWKRTIKLLSGNAAGCHSPLPMWSNITFDLDKVIKFKYKMFNDVATAYAYRSVV